MHADTRTMAVWETAAHLHFLVVEGRLLHEEQGPAVLTRAYEQALGAGQRRRIALVGCGRLGRATLGVPQLAAAGFEIVAAFDADPRQLGQTIRGLTVESVDRLEDALRSSDIATAIVAVPPRYAQGVVDRLVAAGVSTIVSYSATEARAPAHIRVVHVDAIRAFQSSTYLRV